MGIYPITDRSALDQKMAGECVQLVGFRDVSPEWLARRLYRRFKRNDPDAYIGLFDPREVRSRTVIDGRFNLTAIAKGLLREISEFSGHRKKTPK